MLPPSQYLSLHRNYEKAPVVSKHANKFDLVHSSDFSSRLISEYVPFATLIDDLYSRGGIVGSGYGHLSKVEVLHVTAFGKNMTTGDPIIGLMTIRLTLVCDTTGYSIPGVVFLRADAVALIITEFYNGVLWTLLVRQPRAPSGLFTLEAVAGMLQRMESDGHDVLTLSGTAVKELREEAGIVIDANKLEFICEFWPSVGGTREKISCYHVEYSGLVDLVQNSTNNDFGVLEEGEATKRMVMPASEALVQVKDSKFKVGFLQWMHNSNSSRARRARSPDPLKRK